MARIFISHSSDDNEQAIQMRDWLAANGWQDVFLDVDPERGIVAGQRWKEALQKAAHRCEVVLALVSTTWLASAWCKSECDAARLMGKKIIVVLVGIDKREVPPDLLDEQWIELADPAIYRRLREGLARTGLGSSNFSLKPGRRPYPGFAFFEEEDAAIFFGRDAQIVRALDRMRGLVRVGVDRMLVILGASGSGKSSFLRAGILPRLKRDDRTWLPLPVIRPERAVISGKFGLAQALYQIVRADAFADAIRERGLPRSRTGIQDLILENQGGLANLFRALSNIAHVPGLSGEQTQPPTLVLAIDQGEELFNDEGRGEAELFIALLSRTLQADPRALVLMTMRSDAFPLLQTNVLLADVSKDTYTLDMMLEGSYRAVIEGPARLVEPPLTIDAQLVDALLEDISGQDALPLLAFTLAHLYEFYAADNELDLGGYEKLGRLKGVIDTSIKEAFAEGAAKGTLPHDAKAQLALMRVGFIPHLAQVNAAGQFVRRVAMRDDIPPEAQPVIDRFAEQRLLIRDRRSIAGMDAEVIEVAHEALLRLPPLSDLLVEDREFLIWRERLDQARVAFEANERGLLTGRELHIARDWMQRRPQTDVPPADRVFIRDSVVQHETRIATEAEAERTQREAELHVARERADAARRITRRTRAGLAVSLLMALVASVAGYLAYLKGAETLRQNEETLRAQSNYLADLSLARSRQGDAVTGALLSAVALPDPSKDSRDRPLSTRPLVSRAIDSLYLTSLLRHEELVLSTEGDGVLSVAFDNSGNRIVAGLSSGAVRIFTLGPTKHFLDLRGHTRSVIFVAFSPDGSEVYSVSLDETVRIWNSENGVQIRDTSFFSTYEGEERAAGAAFSPTASKIARFSGRKATMDGTYGPSFRIINAITNETILDRNPSNNDRIETVSASFSPNGNLLAIGASDNKVRIIDAATGAQQSTAEGHTAPVLASAFSNDNQLLVTGSADNTARLWNAKTGSVIRSFGGHQDAILYVGFSPDGNHIVTTSADQTAQVWDVSTGHSIVTLRGHTSAVTAAAFSPDGQTVVTSSEDQTVRIWSLRRRDDAVDLLGHTGSVFEASYNPEGTRVVTASADKTAKIWDSRTGAVIATLKGHCGFFRRETPSCVVLSVDFSPDGRQIISTGYDSSVRLWDAANGKPIKEYRFEKPWFARKVFSAKFSPDGTKLVVTADSQSPLIMDIRTGEQIGYLEGHTGEVTRAIFSNNGLSILTVSADGTARLWDSKTLKGLTLLRGHTDHILYANFSPDDMQIITASKDGTARLWNAKTGMEVTILTSGAGPVRSAEFSVDGKLIVTSAEDRVSLWDAHTLKAIAHFGTHTGNIFTAKLSRDGKRVLTASADKLAQIRPIYLGWVALVDSVKAMAPRCLTVAQLREFYLPPEPPRWCITGPGHTSESEPTEWDPKWPYQTVLWRDWLLAKDRGADPQIPN